jgi:hypothetical protein
VKDSSHFLGACEIEHVPYGSFVASLKRWDVVDYMDRGVWGRGTIEDLFSDGSLLRAVKVSACHGSMKDKVWLSVEDGCIAPSGTHTTDFGITSQ